MDENDCWDLTFERISGRVHVELQLPGGRVLRGELGNSANARETEMSFLGRNSAAEYSVTDWPVQDISQLIDELSGASLGR